MKKVEKTGPIISFEGISDLKKKLSQRSLRGSIYQPL